MKQAVMLDKNDLLWLLDHMDGLLVRAQANISVWCDKMAQIQAVRDALASAQPLGATVPQPVAEPETPAKKRRGRTPKPKLALVPEPEKKPEPRKRRGRPAGVAPPPVGVRSKHVATPEKKARAPYGSRAAVLPKLCPDHPSYGAVRRPRTGCEKCWAAFEKYQNPVVVEKAAREVGRKKGVAGRG